MKKYLFLTFLCGPSLLLPAMPFNSYATEKYFAKQLPLIFKSQKEHLIVMTKQTHFNKNINHLTQKLLIEAHALPELGFASASDEQKQKLKQIIHTITTPLLQKLSSEQRTSQLQNSQSSNDQAALTAWLSQTN